jgi:hypothetical protein
MTGEPIFFLFFFCMLRAQVAQVSCACSDAEVLQLSIDVDGGWGRRLAIVGR